MSDDRRDFMKYAAGTAAALFAMPLAAASLPTQKVPLTKPIKVTVIEDNELVDGDRTEHNSTFELHGADGAFHHITAYSMKIDRPEAYDTTYVLKTDKFLQAGDTTSADSEVRIIIVSGDKGLIQGDHRSDEVQTTIIGPEGIFKSPLQAVTKSLVDPYAGLSAEEKAQIVFDSRVKQ